MANQTNNSKRPLIDDLTPTNASKTPRLTEYAVDSPKLWKVMDMRFTKQIQTFEEMLQKSQESLKIMIQDSENNIILNINQKFNEFNQRIDVLSARVDRTEEIYVEVQSLKNYVNNLKSQVAHQANSAVACDLRMGLLLKTVFQNPVLRKACIFYSKIPFC